MNQIIAEKDVLLASTIFLIQRGIIPYQFSVATGRGINAQETIEKIKWLLNQLVNSPLVFQGMVLTFSQYPRGNGGQLNAKVQGVESLRLKETILIELLQALYRIMKRNLRSYCQASKIQKFL